MAVKHCFPLFMLLLWGCSNHAQTKDVEIIGNVEDLPATKVYLWNGVSSKWARVLDSAEYKNGQFRFHIQPTPDFEPFQTCIRFINRQTGELQTLTITDLSKQSLGTNSFVAERGITRISGKVTAIRYNGTNVLQLTVPGNETQVYHQYFGFGSMYGTDSSNAQQRIEYFKNVIRKYPRSYYLLQCIAKQACQFKNERMGELVGAFDTSLQHSKSMAEIQSYMTSRPQKGKPIRLDIPLTDPTGQPAQAVDTAQPLNMVVFWASWCGPCRQEIPMLKKLYAQYQRRGLRMVSISVNEKLDAWRKAMAEEKMPWPQYHADSTAHAAWDGTAEILALPAVFFIDQKGVIVATVRGNDATNDTKFRRVVERYLGKKE